MAETFSERVAGVFGALDSIQAPKPGQETSASHDPPHPDPEGISTSSRELYVPPAKRANKPGASSPPHRHRGDERRLRPHAGSTRFKGHHRGNRVTPDYVHNPGKWTRYDLRDDGTKGLKKNMTAEDINRHAAFQFLGDLEERKKTSDVADVAVPSEDLEEGNMESSKVVFKRPSSKRTAGSDGVTSRTTDSTSEREGGTQDSIDTRSHGNSCHGNGALRMPEYVVGREGGRKRGRRPVAAKGTLLSEREESKDAVHVSSSRSAVSLSHLEDEDED